MHGISVKPSGRFPSERDRPWGSLIAGIPAEAKAIIMIIIIIIIIIVIVIVSSSLEDSKVRVLVEMSFPC